jgi:RNA polymerase sigma factor (sigma-70 family)
MNLRLVVSVAKTRVRAGYDLSECVSDGSVALIRAVDSFDFAKGYRFSTYAVHVIRNMLAENARRLVRHRGRTFALHAESLAAPDPGVDELELEELQNQRRPAVRRWLDRLDKRERQILTRRYGIGGGHKHTLEHIGRDLGLSKERVRQIAARAQAKLREFARREAIEI